MLIAFSTFMLWICSLYYKYDEKLRTYEIGNESKLQVEITFKQNIMLLLEIGWPLLSC